MSRASYRSAKKNLQKIIGKAGVNKMMDKATQEYIDKQIEERGKVMTERFTTAAIEVMQNNRISKERIDRILDQIADKMLENMEQEKK